MAHSLLLWFTQFPPVIATLLMAMFPIVERFALPVALTAYHLPVWEAFPLVIMGNMVPVVAILSLAEKFHNWVTKNDGLFGRAWVKSLAHVQKKFARYEKYGLIGLFLFLVFPSPVNGAFSASLIAFILGYPRRKALPYLFAGIVIGNIIVLIFTIGLDKIF